MEQELNKTEAEKKSFSPKHFIFGVLLALILLVGFLFGISFITKHFVVKPAVIKNEKIPQASTQKTKEPSQDLHKQNQEKKVPAIVKEEPKEQHAKKENGTHNVSHTQTTRPELTGVLFVEATIEPLKHELERFWGWRPNDILNFTDNVNSFQIGVLEVTRRTTVALAERISRTGSNASFDENLERAMNWFMIKATQYWFPSAESKYFEGLDELKNYKDKLKRGEAKFYTRVDNLIPLLAAYEDLLGSCDENLVKNEEDDGKPVSFFKVDDYFYYSQGVASAMETVLEAVMEDFKPFLQNRNGTELLHHAIVSCRKATKIAPWMVMNSDLSSILANHRANLSAPISHARFYLEVLIKTLSM